MGLEPTIKNGNLMEPTINHLNPVMEATHYGLKNTQSYLGYSIVFSGKKSRRNPYLNTFSELVLYYPYKNNIKHMANEHKVFSTRDLYLAATLVTKGFFMIGTDYQIEGGKNQPVGYFKFDDSPSLQEAKQKYTQGLLTVEPKAFIGNVRSLKAEVANIFNNPHSEMNVKP